MSDSGNENSLFSIIKKFATTDDPLFDSDDSNVNPEIILETKTKQNQPVVAQQVTVVIDEKFKLSLISTVSSKVPELKKLLLAADELSAVIPDYSMRMQIVLTQAKISQTELTQLLSSIDNSVKELSKELDIEVQHSKEEKIAKPKNNLTKLQQTKSDLQKQIERINSKIVSAENDLTKHKNEFELIKQKSNAGTDLLIQWATDMKSVLQTK